MTDWETHREVLAPSPLTTADVDRLYAIFLAGMGLALLCGMAICYSLERMFHVC